MTGGERRTRCQGTSQETQGKDHLIIRTHFYASLDSRSKSPAVTDERYIKSATGGYIPGPPISRQGPTRRSARSDIPWYGAEGDDIDPSTLYRNKSRMSTPREISKSGQSLSPNSSSSSTLSSSMSSFIIDDPTSASSATTLKTPVEVCICVCSVETLTTLDMFLRQSPRW